MAVIGRKEGPAEEGAAIRGEEQADELSKAIASRSVITKSGRRSSSLGSLGGSNDGVDLIDVVTKELNSRFDREWGGFGPAPKFPQPTLIDIALRHSRRHTGGDPESSLAMATLTLMPWPPVVSMTTWAADSP